MKTLRIRRKNKLYYHGARHNTTRTYPIPRVLHIKEQVRMSQAPKGLEVTGRKLERVERVYSDYQTFHYDTPHLEGLYQAQGKVKFITGKKDTGFRQFLYNRSYVHYCRQQSAGHEP